MGLANYLAKRLDDQVWLELVDHFDDLKRAGWEDLNALAAVSRLAQMKDASPRALAMFCDYPPIRKVINANPDAQVVQELMGDPGPMFDLPGSG